MVIINEQERTEWDKKQWDLSLKTKNPVESYQEYLERADNEVPQINIDELPNKDWYRA